MASNYSSDLNPLDYVLGAMLESYNKLQPKPNTIPEFKDALQLIWSAFYPRKQSTAPRRSYASDGRHVSANNGHFEQIIHVTDTDSLLYLVYCHMMRFVFF